MQNSSLVHNLDFTRDDILPANIHYTFKTAWKRKGTECENVEMRYVIAR